MLTIFRTTYHDSSAFSDTPAKEIRVLYVKRVFRIQVSNIKGARRESTGAMTRGSPGINRRHDQGLTGNQPAP